ncbi:transcription factor HES-5-like [Alosa sapidissima]|uniref:transcription factor HES-5-like n=1 Tax=Alosa sapidissima TaxID=34773 RepID=UPI001C08BF43|nr:transcription factor HES-5-like [Alosa sapidissima]
MAPTITSSADNPKRHVNLPHKIRKPVVEKMRRDRINKSIEELKDLLGPQLLNQQPDSKLEKADILEMTVYLLRRQLQLKTLQHCDAVKKGFSRCAQEVVYFLSKDSGKTQSYGKLLTQFQTLQPSCDDYQKESDQCQLNSSVQHVQGKDKILTKSDPWRPW